MVKAHEPIILNVDDTDASRYLKSRTLRQVGLRVHEASTGEEALRMVAALKPDVVLLDVRLPDMSGIEVCRRIKADPATSSVLVIQTSATYLEPSDRVRGLEGGADTYLLEPIDSEELIANVRAMLRLRRAEQALRDREAWLTTTLHSIGDGVLATDLEGHVTLMNPAAQSMLGWEEGEATGRKLSEIFEVINEETFGPGDQLVDQILHAGGISGFSKNALIVGRIGRRVSIDHSASPMRDGQGNVTGLVLVFRDVSERKLFEKEREELLEREKEARLASEKARFRAEEASRLKDEFLATVSHELTSPLNSISGWARILRTGNLDAQQSARALETIERSAKSQNQLINDLLDVSRIITGKMRLDVGPVPLGAVIEAAVDTVRPAADAKSIHLTVSLDPAADMASGDAERLQQVMWNLLSNAIKFTPRGGQVDVILTRIDSHVEITVADDGNGINPEFLPYVFDRFRQEDARFNRQHGGLGLGLAIVRHLVELHGGTVHAESPGLGQGATFTVVVPVFPEPIALAPGGRRKTNGPLEGLPSLEGRRVLVVDNDADGREVVAMILVQQGAEVQTAPSTAEALNVLETWRPDVLISDIGMPDQNGYTLLETLREREQASGERPVPAIALTAYARHDDRIRALSAGYQLHVPKPVEPSELLMFVARLAERGESSHPPQ
jgi:PAS domain S-box-containing protein